MEPYGYNGRILRVDLSTRTSTEEQPPPILYRRYLGGGALSLYYLLNELKPGVDPLGPENVLIFAATAVTGHPAAGFSRFSVAAKSPLTGAFGESEAGGWWGPELKFAGYDAIVIKGKANKPVYLWIQNGKAESPEVRKIEKRHELKNVVGGIADYFGLAGEDLLMRRKKTEAESKPR